MQTGVKQVFHFGAAATAMGGHLNEPFRYIETPCSVSLPSGGGRLSSKVSGPSTPVQKEISYTNAYTFVTGKPTDVNGPWTHRAVSVVEGFNLLDRIKADRLVAQVLVEHPAYGRSSGGRMISFAGSRFENLQVDGVKITPAIHSGFFPAGEPDVDPYDPEAWTTPSVSWKSISVLAHKQGTRWKDDQTLPAWVHARYSWVAAPADPDEPNPAGYTLCSLVNSIDGLDSGPNAAHCFELPDFGRVFLGEIVHHQHSLKLAMVRAELGCKVSGQASGGCVDSNGTTCPPSYSGN